MLDIGMQAQVCCTYNQGEVNPFGFIRNRVKFRKAYTQA